MVSQPSVPAFRLVASASLCQGSPLISLCRGSLVKHPKQDSNGTRNFHPGLLRRHEVESLDSYLKDTNSAGPMREQLPDDYKKDHNNHSYGKTWRVLSVPVQSVTHHSEPTLVAGECLCPLVHHY